MLKEGGAGKELKSKKGGKNSVLWNFSVFPLKYRMFSEFCATWWIAKKSENSPLTCQAVLLVTHSVCISTVFSI